MLNVIGNPDRGCVLYDFRWEVRSVNIVRVSDKKQKAKQLITPTTHAPTHSMAENDKAVWTTIKKREL